MRKSVAKVVPLARCCVIVDWASEKLAENLVEYVDAFNDDPTRQRSVNHGKGHTGRVSEKTRRQQSLAGKSRHG
jgi:hypothetical protein